MYINDLALALDFSKVAMYADDTSISYSSKSVDAITSAIDDHLSNLKLWLEVNTLRKLEPCLSVAGQDFRIKR